MATDLRLNLGCGPDPLPGWANIDSVPYPGVDRVLDLRKGIPYRGVRFIRAEHFIEHLPLEDARRLLAECRRALAPDGVLRLSTPNLDWVWASHYRPSGELAPDDAVRDCFRLNRAFYGWGHRFLYNRPALEAALAAAGFAEVRACVPGESVHPELRGLEARGGGEGTEELPDCLIVEASGVAEPSAVALEINAEEFRRDTDFRWHPLQYAVLWVLRGLSRILGRKRP